MKLAALMADQSTMFLAMHRIRNWTGTLTDLRRRLRDMHEKGPA